MPSIGNVQKIAPSHMAVAGVNLPALLRCEEQCRRLVRHTTRVCLDRISWGVECCARDGGMLITAYRQMLCHPLASHGVKPGPGLCAKARKVTRPQRLRCDTRGQMRLEVWT
jgi:hypothetical protein